MDRALARRTSDIDSLIQRDIGPDDGRLVGVLAECRRFTEPSLRRGVSCTTADEHGWSVATICNQSFAYRHGSNRVQPVEPREAIDLGVRTVEHLMDQVGRTPQAAPPGPLEQIGPPRVTARIVAVAGHPIVPDGKGDVVGLALAQRFAPASSADNHTAISRIASDASSELRRGPLSRD